MPNTHQPAAAAPDPRRETKCRPQPDPLPPDRHQSGQHQRRDADSRADREDQLGRHRQAGEVAGLVVVLAERNEDQVRGDHYQAGDDGRERWRSEAPVRLQDAVEHHREPVQQDLRSEHRQHVPGDGCQLRLCAVRPGIRRVEQAGQRTSRQRDHQADRRQDQHCPGQHRRRGLGHVGCRGRVGGRLAGRPGQQRHHDAGKRPAQDDVVNDVGQRVRRHVRGAQAVGADCLGEHRRPDQSEQPRDHGQPGDQSSPAGDAGPGGCWAPGSWPSCVNGMAWPVTGLRASVPAGRSGHRQPHQNRPPQRPR